MMIRELVLSILSTLVIFNLALAEPSGCPDFEVELPRAGGPQSSAAENGRDARSPSANGREDRKSVV